MALHITDPETDRLARELARLTGETITVAVRTAVQERLVRLRSADRSAKQLATVERIQADLRASGIDCSRTEDEILGYDERGIPESGTNFALTDVKVALPPSDSRPLPDA